MSRRQHLIRLETILLIAVGGFAGSNLRYFVEQVVPASLAATFAVNVVGSFALGLIVYESARIGAFSDQARFVFGTGFLSSFTTYSTFVVGVLTATPALGMAYLLASYAAGIAAVLAARASVRSLGTPQSEEVV
ncbi:CrcB protein [Natronoarchaeum philippinense]|uniref:Fluoride-specific ion channel FluC n=1 Tax=Natronoarchaeum philippinense TaxID=558529 RepID=A0A285N4T2_NATPI|nr:CrcB family protein [Natronoarchaeum philippinense]SNZ04484.1 CrcB protein [Natronoarchaeum philippinense]